VTRQRVVAIAALLLLGGAAAAAARVTRRPMSPLHEQERAHPGPDSGRVAKVLADLKAMDPLLCGLLVDQIGNFWSNGDRGGYGVLADAPPKSYAARDSLFSHTSDPKAIALLLTQLKEETSCARRGAAKLLGRSTIATSRLVELMNDPSPRIQEAAAYAIGEAERYDARAALEARMTSTSEPLAAMAAWGLAEMRDSVSDATFLRALSSRHARVRIAGARGLGDSENKEHRGALERALRDEDASVREAIVHALGDIGDPASANALAGALSDQDRRVRLRAAYALGDLDELERAPAALVRAAESTDMELAEAAINALAEIHDPATVDVLIGRLTSPSRDIRLRVVEALGNIGSQKAVPGLMRALKDADAEVRRAAAEALGDIKEGER
jgi:HEAT repeat protein